MAPRGRKVKAGLRREDAARDNMRQYGFEEHVINETIKELVQLYGEDGGKLIEDGGYNVLLTRCLERQEEEAKHVTEVQREETCEEENEEIPKEEEEETHGFGPHEQEQHVKDGRDHAGSNSTSLVESGTETGTQTCQPGALSNTNEAVMDSSPATFQSGVASPDYAHHSVGGAKSSHCGWLSAEEEETEPLCEELLEELIRELRGENKRKRPSRWDN